MKSYSSLLFTLIAIMCLGNMFVSADSQAATLAHWDFNDPGLGAADGAAVPDSDGQTVWRKSAADKSGNGNDLTTWDWEGAGFNWSSDSPAGDFSIVNGGSYPAAMTWSEQSLPAGTDIETITPSAFTIEAVVKLNSIDGVATIVGRDGQDIGGAVDTVSRAPLYFSVRDWYGVGNQSLAIEFTDVQGYTHSAGGNGFSNLAFNTWYHVAAVSDGSTLKLYIDYVEVASDDMTLSGSTDTRLATGTGFGSDWQAGTFTLARGLYDGGHTDRWFGYIDEVSISDAALEPAFFVIQIPQSPPAAPSGLAATAGNNAVTLNWADNIDYVAGYNVYRSTTSGGPYTPIALGLSNSIYRDDTVVNGTTYYYVVTAVGALDNESDQSSEVLATPYVPAPRYMEKLDRGVVAVYRGGSNVYIGWRMFGTEPETVGYNVYRGGTKLNASPITGSTNYTDNGGSLASTYRVAAVINSIEQELSDPVAVWSDFYHDIPVEQIPGDTNWEYSPNDASVGDLDGDGEYEIVVKRIPPAAGVGQIPYVEAYEMDGTFLWRISLGPNITDWVELNQIVYDFDGDGRAEVAIKTSELTTFGDGVQIGDTDGDGITDYSSSAVWNSSLYMTEGPEFLSIIDGQTGAELARTDYIGRDPIEQWGLPGQNLAQLAHRSYKFHMTPAYLDGQRPSLVICRGIYELIKMEAWNYRNGELTKVWDFTSADWPGFSSQGNHNFTVGDVDNDGKDEIVYGSMCVDDNGSGLYTTRLGHGDALHMSDMIPDRPGLEVVAVHETGDNGTTLRDAGTGEILWQKTAEGDTGRGCAAHIDSRYPGYQMWSVASGGTYNAADKSLISTNLPNWGNFLIWWDGDLQREILDDISTHNYPYIDKWYGDGAGRLLSLYNIPTAYATSSNNWTKGTPCLSGDILGDWREECIYRSSDNTKLRIFTTTDVTSSRIYTLMHDPQYRLAIAWQVCGYNQPPHPGFYIGAGMSPPPTPNIFLVGTPVFSTDPISNLDGIESSDYTGNSLASYAEDAEGIETLTFSKDSGPAWLVVASDGTLSGIPSDRNVGENVFTVRVTDDGGLYDTAEMTIDVANVYSGVQGMDDLLGMAAQWLKTDCTDTPACGGADLDGDHKVTFTDFSILAYNWLVDYDLQLWLRFDEMAGDVAGDSSVYDRPGQLVNSPAWSAGHDGGALTFDGSNYAEVANDAGLNPEADSFSVAFWMKSDTASQGALIVSKRLSTDPYPGYLIGLSNGTPTSFSPGSKLTYLLGADSGDHKGGYTTSDIDFSEWTHVCVVLDQDANTVYVYINGVSVPVTMSLNDSLPTINTTTPVYIGKYPSISTKPYYGQIDDVRIYNTALTQQEIQDIASL